tara:strand:- start:2157 stop:2396 length:240 start_codon:yes stop_codon:yes gene_type:complete
MTKLFSYVKYSEASFQMSNEYIALFIITSGIWILLWLGYRKNKISDENKKREKQARIQLKTERRKKLESLYPSRNKNYN